MSIILVTAYILEKETPNTHSPLDVRRKKDYNCNLTCIRKTQRNGNRPRKSGMYIAIIFDEFIKPDGNIDWLTENVSQTELENDADWELWNHKR